jgi:hypothetical protein
MEITEARKYTNAYTHLYFKINDRWWHFLINDLDRLSHYCQFQSNEEISWIRGFTERIATVDALKILSEKTNLDNIQVY